MGKDKHDKTQQQTNQAKQQQQQQKSGNPYASPARTPNTPPLQRSQSASELRNPKTSQQQPSRQSQGYNKPTDKR